MGLHGRDGFDSLSRTKYFSVCASGRAAHDLEISTRDFCSAAFSRDYLSLWSRVSCLKSRI